MNEILLSPAQNDPNKRFKARSKAELKQSLEQQRQLKQEWQVEGKAQFQVGEAFFRPDSRPARDLGVLAAALYRQQNGRLRVLETMAGSGIRSLRYSLEAQADLVWTNDGNGDITALRRSNLERNLAPDCYRLTQERAAQPLARCCADEDFYDLVDIDAFGSGGPFMAAAVGATAMGGLIYLTATDARTLAGRAPEKSLRAYGVYGRIHPSCQEQGLRMLIGGLWEQASARGFGLRPIFSYFGGQTYRVMVQLLSRSPGPEESGVMSAQFPKTHPPYGFLGYCHQCGEYQCLGWRKLSRATCPHHSEPLPLTLSGPQWLGPLHNRDFLAQMRRQAQAWNWPSIDALLAVMSAEATLPPYHFPLGELGKWGKMDPPKRDRLIRALQAEGYAASPTQFSAQALKTNASLHDCIALSQDIAFGKGL